MTGIFNDLLELIKEFLSGIGIENWLTQIITSGLAFVFIVILIIKQIVWVFNLFLSKYRNKKTAKDLHPFYSVKEVENATKYYIKTKFQNVPPSEDEEPGRNYIAAARQPLIPLFLHTAFKSDVDDTKYYLILADSGMGKTTFMINLYLAYKYKRTWFWQSPKFNIRLFPLGHPNSLNRIREIPTSEKENTILLLDAFDEDNKAVENYKQRLAELLEYVWEFREIVITCRTQFFPSSKSEPIETGKYKFGPDSGQYIFQKIYLSIFTEKDIKLYLKKRFKSILLFKSQKHLKALRIVLKSPNLMMRPMLLSHIEDLVNIEKPMKFGFQIYEVLINEWLNRESNKAGIIEKYGKGYKELLYNFSKALARDLYLNSKKRGNKLSLNVNEIIDNPNGLQIKDIEGNIIEIDKYDQGSRSLLNRNAIGEFKFSHKSILEYFLALEVYNNPSFRTKFKFSSDLDTAKKFFLEMIVSNKLSDEDVQKMNLVKLGFDENEVFEYKKIVFSTASYQELLETMMKGILGDAFIKLTFGVMISAVGSVTMAIIRKSTLSQSTFFLIISASVFLTGFTVFSKFKKIKNEMKNEMKEESETSS